MNQLNGGTHQLLMTSRSVVNGHERIGTLAQPHLQHVASVSAISGNGRAQPTSRWAGAVEVPEFIETLS